MSHYHRHRRQPRSKGVQPVYLTRGQRIYLTRRLRQVEARLRDAASEAWAPLDLVDATRREVATIRGILKQLREARTDG